jgi:hypothetical protein
MRDEILPDLHSLHMSRLWRNLFRGLSAVAIAAGPASSLLLPSCGVMSSGQCADKATCPEPDSDAQVTSVDVTVDGVDVQMETDGDGAAVRTDVTIEVANSNEAAEDASADLGSKDAASETTSSDVDGADTVDASVDARTGGDVAIDRPSDAVFMGDTAACGPCTNVCVPSFVQCCISDGGCGCIEFFFPVACL